MFHKDRILFRSSSCEISVSFSDTKDDIVNVIPLFTVKSSCWEKSPWIKMEKFGFFPHKFDFIEISGISEVTETYNKEFVGTLQITFISWETGTEIFTYPDYK